MKNISFLNRLKVLLQYKENLQLPCKGEGKD